MENNQHININKRRIYDNLNRLSAFGRNENGGIDRSFGDKADIEARKWIEKLWKEDLGLKVKIDPIANIWAKFNGQAELSPIVIGSHHDAVANGGMYDGALGVMLATEVMQTLKENNIRLKHPFCIVSFSAEEPNSFNISTLGSKVLSGKLTEEKLKNVMNETKSIKLEDAVLKLGGNLNKINEALLKPNDIGAFIECHVEQGRNLYDKKLSLGVVTKITGIYREKISIVGEANHAGTTLMRYRHDALLAASEVCLELERIIKKMGRDNLVGTVGNMNVSPNSANIIPGEVSLILDIRSTDYDIVKKVIDKIANKMCEISTERGVSFIRKTILNQPEVTMDETVRASLKKAANMISEPFIELPSMAGHDAAHIAKVVKTAMLFVPSIEGKSHCPSEETDIDDIEKAGNTLLQAVLILDKELDKNEKSI
ncbi:MULTISPECIES: M20 family metallo-hydrolase [Clostridium]|uniref:M20 family metallo-hydrolase n=1 Tax=Clostridium TaxID=1485 RepID=UPI0008271CB7|nr:MULTISPECIES: M20 family metallo-hydrolase [Clostridium]PJI08837.1 Zn-dependent hydrolase [Clostridium sp. CT7]